MKHTLEKQENLEVKQAEIVDIKVEDGKVKSIETNVGAIYNVKALILATGTYLKGKIFIGEFSEESGPDGVAAANKLSDSLKKLGINLIRFKTGTPARINRKSIDFSKMEVQKGDSNIVPFSFEDEIKDFEMVWVVVSEEDIIIDNLNISSFNDSNYADLKEIKNGVLGDIAPTILKLMGIQQPEAMSCESLI
jgi:tRNA uridine 5-carboxymethylaminomethyl modification enzyme